MPAEVLDYGVVYELLNTGLTSLVGTAYALPPSANVISWQHVEAGSPSVISHTIQGSLDGINFNTVDTDTVITGNIRTITFNGIRFIRANLGSRTGGTISKVSVVLGR